MSSTGSGRMILVQVMTTCIINFGMTNIIYLTTGVVGIFSSAILISCVIILIIRHKKHTTMTDQGMYIIQSLDKLMLLFQYGL